MVVQNVIPLCERELLLIYQDYLQKNNFFQEEAIIFFKTYDVTAEKQSKPFNL